MDKPINTSINPIPMIQPLDEIITAEDELRLATEEEKNEIMDENIILTHKEVFIDMGEEKGKGETEETIKEEDEIAQPLIPSSPIKRGVGKRGRDKKKRKYEMTPARLAHLDKIRVKAHAAKKEKARLRREAKAGEKQAKKERNAELRRVKKAEDYRKKKEEEAKALEKRDLAEERKQLLREKRLRKKKQFFENMEEYERYKLEKHKLKQVIPQSQPHPANRVFKKPTRPAAPPPPQNPFDAFIQYGGRKSRWI